MSSRRRYYHSTRSVTQYDDSLLMYDDSLFMQKQQQQQRKQPELYLRDVGLSTRKSKRKLNTEPSTSCAANRYHKRRKKSIETDCAAAASQPDLFDNLPDDLVNDIMCKVGVSTSRPRDFISVTLASKRMRRLALSAEVLSKVSEKTFDISAKKWSESAHKFLKLCADCGNVKACYILGMIYFYCLQQRNRGASLMAKAATNNYAPALYSLAIIQFNGSGASKNHKNLIAGVALCARAAALGHIDAIRELGHCLQDGYGIKQNIEEGRHLLVRANARELASVVASSPTSRRVTWQSPAGLWSDFGCNVPLETHTANKFLCDWFNVSTGGTVWLTPLRMCSHIKCGRPETRLHEFRRCSVCGLVNYCSRACQALDWKIKHKAECRLAMQNRHHGNVFGGGNGLMES